MTRLNPARFAQWLAFAYLIPVALVTLISAAWSLNPLIFVFAMLGFLWQVGPVAISALFARRSARPAGAWAFVFLQIAIFGFAAWIWYVLLVVDPDPQVPIALFIFVPLYEYLAVGLFAVIAMMFGWRMRGPAPKNPGGGAKPH